ncbi:hypothetical protein NDU88_005960 [Pleurodeles waltl]|uniref:Uncharacterized protein n=1 Tax=Pleurodeles waltl TaxID=8319 RepID=A0AAV7QGJ7_PLEWA|nr:hypothetical protein NDU88_005960 [Pleurodeles waltl]
MEVVSRRQVGQPAPPAHSFSRPGCPLGLFSLSRSDSLMYWEVRDPRGHLSSSCQVSQLLSALDDAPPAQSSRFFPVLEDFRSTRSLRWPGRGPPSLQRRCHASVVLPSSKARVDAPHHRSGCPHLLTLCVGAPNPNGAATVLAKVPPPQVLRIAALNSLLHSAARDSGFAPRAPRGPDVSHSVPEPPRTFSHTLSSQSGWAGVRDCEREPHGEASSAICARPHPRHYVCDYLHFTSLAVSIFLGKGRSQHMMES